MMIQMEKNRNNIIKAMNIFRRAAAVSVLLILVVSLITAVPSYLPDAMSSGTVPAAAAYAADEKTADGTEDDAAGQAAPESTAAPADPQTGFAQVAMEDDDLPF